MVKLDAAGAIQWDKTIGGDAHDELHSLRQTTDGGYILGGYSNSNISGEKTQNSRGDYDYWVVKLDATGAIQWDKTIGGDAGDALLSLQQTADGGYILGGYSSSNISGEKTENGRGDEDYWVVKLDATGAIQWDKTIGGDASDRFSSLQQTADKGFILGGTSNSGISGEKTQRKRGKNDYWVVKLDAAGAIQGDKAIGGDADDELLCLQQTADSGYILGGYSGSNISGEKTENSRGGGQDYWVVKLSKTGYVQYDKTIGGIYADVCYTIIEVKKNRYVLGGSSNSPVSGEKSQKSRGDKDYWAVTLKYTKPAVTVAGSESGLVGGGRQTLVAYPNPAKDILHIQTTGKAIFTLATEAGVTVLTQTISGKGEMNLSRLQPGVYYLKNNNTDEVQKIIVQ